MLVGNMVTVKGMGASDAPGSCVHGRLQKALYGSFMSGTIRCLECNCSTRVGKKIIGPLLGSCLLTSSRGLVLTFCICKVFFSGEFVKNRKVPATCFPSNSTVSLGTRTLPPPHVPSVHISARSSEEKKPSPCRINTKSKHRNPLYLPPPLLPLPSPSSPSVEMTPHARSAGSGWRRPQAGRECGSGGRGEEAARRCRGVGRGGGRGGGCRLDVGRLSTPGWRLGSVGLLRTVSLHEAVAALLDELGAHCGLQP